MHRPASPRRLTADPFRSLILRSSPCGPLQTLERRITKQTELYHSAES